MYEALDAFLDVHTWDSGHPLDRRRFYNALRPIVSRPEFNAEQMREYISRKFDLDSKLDTHPIRKAIDYYVDAAGSIHEFLMSAE